jgi:predicted Zn finger-like uncharacterized protein
MILTCPSCGTRYQMDRTHLAPPGGEVRCAKCLTVWFHAVSEKDVSPEQDRDEAGVIAKSEIGSGAEAPSLMAPQAESRTRLALVAGLGALTIFFGTFFWAAIAFRQEIATVWPQSESLYALINLPVNAQGLAFEEITQERVTENGESVMQISGRVINVSERELSVPAIHVSLRDAEEHEIYGWTFNAGVATLGPGQSSPFLARLPNPPAEAVRTELGFAPGRAP